LWGEVAVGPTDTLVLVLLIDIETDVLEEDVVEDDFVEDDVVDDNFVEDDVVEDDYVEDDVVEDDFVEDDDLVLELEVDRLVVARGARFWKSSAGRARPEEARREQSRTI